jgi:uncharacterized protein YecT (DUF1311 family)
VPGMKILTFAILTLVSAAAQAERVFDSGGVKIDVAASPTYTSCFTTADGNDLAMAECIDAEIALWDKRLNAAYAKLRGWLPKDDFAAVQTFQRVWVGDRDVTCRDDGQSGTTGRVSAASCILRLTAVRSAELETRGGDNSPPVPTPTLDVTARAPNPKETNFSNVVVGPLSDMTVCPSESSSSTNGRSRYCTFNGGTVVQAIFNSRCPFGVPGALESTVGKYTWCVIRRQ